MSQLLVPLLHILCRIGLHMLPPLCTRCSTFWPSWPHNPSSFRRVVWKAEVVPASPCVPHLDLLFFSGGGGGMAGWRCQRCVQAWQQRRQKQHHCFCCKVDGERGMLACCSLHQTRSRTSRWGAVPYLLGPWSQRG